MTPESLRILNGKFVKAIAHMLLSHSDEMIAEEMHTLSRRLEAFGDVQSQEEARNMFQTYALALAINNEMLRRLEART